MQADIAVRDINLAIKNLPKNDKIKLIEKLINENGLLDDLLDIFIAKERLIEPEEDYEEYRRERLTDGKIENLIC